MTTTRDPRSPDVNLDDPTTPQLVDWIGSITLDASEANHRLILEAADGNPERAMLAPVEYVDGVSLAQLQAALAAGTLEYKVVSVVDETSVAVIELYQDGVLLAKGQLQSDHSGDSGDRTSDFETDADGWTSTRLDVLNPYTVACGDNENGRLSYKILRDAANNEIGTLYRWQHKLPDGTVAGSFEYTIPKR